MGNSDKLIMVVDDEPTMCQILERILSGEGYRVVAAMDGERALKLFKEHHPDLVLLDLMLPGMDGREICRRIRMDSQETMIIYLSAKAAPRGPGELKKFRSEADGYILKPATSKQILSGVKKALASARDRGKPSSP